ncbi:UNVERIFIED_CONTAM: hypothetical protein Slati_0067300 [Sesamum latifolium]|uniref:Transposase MuDR plant domain-containing protein n=1 Tax=Sesamum latifolium TaxID=2727402 RepID=A0AAW2Y8L7_9LAMI
MRLNLNKNRDKLSRLCINTRARNFFLQSFSFIFSCNFFSLDDFVRFEDFSDSKVTNMAEHNNVDIVIHFGGQWTNSNGSVSYDRSPMALLNISRRTTFDELELILCEELGFVGRTDYKLHIYFKYITVNFGERSEILLPIKKDRDVKKNFNPRNGYASIDVFVEAEKIIENTVLDDPAVGEWGTYMSMLTQDLPSLPVVTEAMGRFELYENYSGSSSYATPSNYAGPSDNAGPSSYVGQSNYAGPSSNAGPSTYSVEDDDPEGDSCLNNERLDSEPDEVEREDQIEDNHENDDEVSINIMLDVLGNNADVPPTPVHDHFDLNMPAVSAPPYNLYPVPPFFTTTHPEIPAVSIDVPTGNWGHFYDSNTGELYLGMIFKSKDHLKASVQDFSVRHARREYKVVESHPKLWKVCCKMGR